MLRFGRPALELAALKLARVGAIPCFSLGTSTPKILRSGREALTSLTCLGAREYSSIPDLKKPETSGSPDLKKPETGSRKSWFGKNMLNFVLTFGGVLFGAVATYLGRTSLKGQG